MEGESDVVVVFPVSQSSPVCFSWVMIVIVPILSFDTVRTTKIKQDICNLQGKP